MRTKLLLLLLMACGIAVAAWLVHAPKSTDGDDIPEEQRDTVHKGLEYLVKHQLPDGHWEGEGGQHPVAMTGLVGLALLMDIRARLEFADNAKPVVSIRRAADWLIDKSPPSRDGLIFSGHPSEIARYMEGHGLATLFLAGVRQREDDTARQKKLIDVVTRAVRYIGKARSSRGGWYHTSRVEGHDFDAILPTVIQTQALQAAEKVGSVLASEIFAEADEYLKTELDRQRQTSRRSAADTAAALVGRIDLGLNGDFAITNNAITNNDAWCKTWLEYCRAEIPTGRNTKFGRDELAHYYYAQALQQLGGDYWSTYGTAMFEQLQATQNKDGSWPVGDGISVGAVYSTALWCTVLQLDYGTHPSRVQLEKRS